ncbi:DEAD/DEAH box helicase [Novispirillum itersonii]|uniref:DEAD/DEAH box helicase n=1 Tax=Novispirillum itersonii TaxID=189 RepID=UPI00035CCD8A|nr:AAA domain-containing protein [Novispirillum itersonii]
MDRPFIAYKIGELEDAFAERNEDGQLLKLLMVELAHRRTPRAVKLMAEVQLRLKEPPAKIARSPEPELQTAAATAPRSVSVQDVPARRIPPQPAAPGTPQATLDAWVALEVLSPQSYRRPEDLAGGDKQAVARIDQARLPWDAGGEPFRKGFRLYYQIVLGSVRLEETVKRILDVYADRRVERPATRGNAALAVVVVDQHGMPVEASAVGVSSFGWAVPHALAGNLDGLAGWPAAEMALTKAMEGKIRRTDQDGNVLPLTRQMITELHEWLTGTLGLPADLIEPPSFAIRTFQHFKQPDSPEPLLLNSFFLGDLASARSAFLTGRATPNLRRYLGVEYPASRKDLLCDHRALEAAIAPALIPPARWPGKGRHPLVLLQQAAVNAAIATLQDDGILAVNGPPGTGKTTLLRDLVAALVTARAEVMAGFDDPQQAFTHSGEKVKAGQAWLHLYRIDHRLKGFEILVASSNNKAVENVSAELPGLDALAEDAGLGYFRCLSDALHAPKKTWGLIAAVLGNATNRSKFRQTFWWDSDIGMSTYLAAAAGTPQMVEDKDPATGKTFERPPKIVLEEDPPANHEEALARWRRAREVFRQALKRSRQHLLELETARQAVQQLDAAAERESAASQALDAARRRAAAAEADRSQVEDAVRDAALAAEFSRAQLESHGRARPGFLHRLLRSAAARQWKALHDPLMAGERAARAILQEAQSKKRACELQCVNTMAAVQQAERALRAAVDEHAALRGTVKAARARLGNAVADSAFFVQPHAELHKATPWMDEAVQRTRDDVFIAAMQLHKAFIDAAAKPLRHNLGNLMNIFAGKAMPDEAKAALVPDLWASLFLVVPLFSTTFASVGRMLGALPPQSLGWLLVDEAGQALPQAAVGALMRTRRAVVVGDPLQIEPVVVLPDTLTKAICRQFGADPDRFNAPDASVQTLADVATPYMAEFDGRNGSREVGVPLLVHRRCAEPMFGVSNVTAYNRLMVQAKKSGASRIRDVLGPSAWIDVQGGGADKWSPEEGREVIGMLRRLVDARIGFDDGKGPDIYLVTPFVIVADTLRVLVEREKIAENWGGNSWQWARERIGTVHTVQGREAEAVILVLGAPAATQAGARTWAGERPNLLNVAVTRAKECLYVVGNRELWRKAGVFQALDERLPN